MTFSEVLGGKKMESVCPLPLWLSWYGVHLQRGRPEFHPWAGEGKGCPLLYSGLENSMDYSMGSQRVGHD